MLFNLPAEKEGSDSRHRATAQSSTNQQLYNLDIPVLKEGLSSIVPKQEAAKNDLFRTIYQQDAVAGATLDLITMLPFSDFSLTGVQDPQVLRIFEDSLSHLDVQTLLPQIMIEFLVIGKVINTLVFNETEGIFTDSIIQDPNSCIIQNIPLQGHDPKVDIKIPPEFRKFLTSKDKRDRKAVEEIPTWLLRKLLSGKIDLDPLNTLFLARKTFPWDTGTSYLSRIVPFFALEQTLLQGTISSALRRQRAVLHIQAGADDWEPTTDELSAYVDLFVGANMDPLGAVLATRKDVNVNEILAGGEFWKVTEDWDTITQAKMRALGINEAFLTGEATYATMDRALSVFIEFLRTLRQYITNRVFYMKIFPLLSRVHRFVKRSQAELDHGIRTTGGAKDLLLKDLIIPEIQWHKQLQPQYDTNYLDILSTLEEKGIPIPVRVWAAAGGFSTTKLLDSLEDDLQVWAKISKYQEDLKKIKPKGEEEAFSSVERSIVPYVPLKTGPKSRDKNKFLFALGKGAKADKEKTKQLMKNFPESLGDQGKSVLGQFS
jgi:hypothetical protein